MEQYVIADHKGAFIRKYRRIPMDTDELFYRGIEEFLATHRNLFMKILEKIFHTFDEKFVVYATIRKGVIEFQYYSNERRPEYLFKEFKYILSNKLITSYGNVLTEELFDNYHAILSNLINVTRINSWQNGHLFYTDKSSNILIDSVLPYIRRNKYCKQHISNIRKILRILKRNKLYSPPFQKVVIK